MFDADSFQQALSQLGYQQMEWSEALHAACVVALQSHRLHLMQGSDCNSHIRTECNPCCAVGAATAMCQGAGRNVASYENTLCLLNRGIEDANHTGPHALDCQAALALLL